MGMVISLFVICSCYCSGVCVCIARSVTAVDLLSKQIAQQALLSEIYDIHLRMINDNETP